MDSIAALLSQPQLKTIAIVGVSKNSGKTTALNHVVESLSGSSDRLGLMSIGIDGEEADFWLGVVKPRVRVREGFLVATADKALKGGTAQARVVVRTGAVTALGELVLVRIEKAGTLLLAGVRHKADVRTLVDSMFRHGARKVLIDGSYQRLMAADPEVSQGVILATGAILGRTPREVARRTRSVLDRLLLPPLEAEEDRRLLLDAQGHGRPAIRDATGRIVLLAEPGATTDESAFRDAMGKAEATVAVPGVVSDRLLRILAAHRGGKVRLLATDPTRFFVSDPVFGRFRERGGDLQVGRAVRLLAIAVNPVSVLGYELPVDALTAAVQALAPDIPVFAFREAATAD